MSSDFAIYKVALIGCSWLGAVVLERLVAAGFQVCVITEPGERRVIAAAEMAGVHVVAKARSAKLAAGDFPWSPDLIVSAHSFRIIPDEILRFAKDGGIGYHPSLLPAYKGRNSVQDCLDAHEQVTGGTVYRLTDEIDGGGILLQEAVAIREGETALDLWIRALAPLGVRLLMRAVAESAFDPPNGKNFRPKPRALQSES